MEYPTKGITIGFLVCNGKGVEMMQTQAVNTALCQWLDEKCHDIETAVDGRKRYGAFQRALYELYGGGGIAPVREWPGKDYVGVERDENEIVITLQALCWCALASGMKTETVKKSYEMWKEVIGDVQRCRQGNR